MPLVSLDGLEAVRIRKENPDASWGNRNSENRIEPLAKPAFEVPFLLKPKEKIFTIGSCFARHVEGVLLNHGFQIPMRKLFKTPEFEGLDVEIVNNFGTPSIYNELAWAFGEAEFDEDASFVEVGKDKYIDVHMVNSIKPAPIELVRARRRGVAKATRALADCRVLIMTLGLVELWWDELSQSYLNTAPMPSTLKQSPERFSLHVLNFHECYKYLSGALDIAFKHGPKDLQVILTVSPVPMMTTHRPVDVITANCYSKSVLRTAAEQAVVTYKRVSYFPSYETITISDRRLAWMDDLVHVNKSMIEFNVERMVNAYTGSSARDAEKMDEADTLQYEPAEALMLVESARAARQIGDGEFFETHGQWSAQSPAFAIEHARFLGENGDLDGGIDLIRNDPSNAAQLLLGQLELARGNYEEAIAAIRPLCERRVKGPQHWHVWLEAAAGMRDVDAVLAVEKHWLLFTHGGSGSILFHVGRALRRLGAFELAAERLVVARSEYGVGNALVAIECAMALIDLDRPGEALAAIKGVHGQTEPQSEKLAHLRKSLGLTLSEQT